MYRDDPRDPYHALVHLMNHDQNAFQIHYIISRVYKDELLG
jgi:hypothetical protein